MLARVYLVDHRQQLIRTPKRIQVHNQCLGRFVQLARSIEELPPQCLYVVPEMIFSQRLGQVGRRVVHQGHQPKRKPMQPSYWCWPESSSTEKTRPLPIGGLGRLAMGV